MELMRAWGLEDAVKAGAAGVEPRAWVTPNLASEMGHEMPLGYPTVDEAARVSPTRATWVPQDHHEPILLEYLRTLPAAEVRFRCELVSLVHDDSGVEATLMDRQSSATFVVRAQYAIAADGAHSTMREALGLSLIGPDDLAEFHRVEFIAPLAEVVGDRRYGLYVITDPNVAGVFAPRGRGQRWGFSREWMPGRRRLDEHSESELVALVALGAGVAKLHVQIEQITSFAFAAQIANHYRLGRCFLVGDAAHRMTPRGGTGMNTAIQDAFDLGWKLAWVLLGWAPEALVDTYERERRPVALHNVGRAAEPGGARRDTEDALPWDLNGRLAHHWMPRGQRTVSTLDLIGSGLTLFASPEDGRWSEPMTAAPCSIDVHVLDGATADAYDLASAGALLVRPDAHEVCRWKSYDANWVGAGVATLSCAG
jgi:putative polyketide hydroxylase